MAILDKIQTVEDIKDQIKGRRVLVRVDFNVPIKEGAVTDNTRIKETLPTIKFLIENGAKVILMSHLGRPEGKPDPKYSLRPVANELSKLLDKKVDFVEDCKGPKVADAVSKMQQGELLLLENVRFYKEEEKNDEAFAKELASIGDIFVSDAFACAHRAHASVVGIANYLKSVAGFLMLKEIKYLSEILENPKKPFVAVLGGAKVSDKIAVMSNLLDRVDRILIGGGMAFTFLKSQGSKVGSTKTEDDKLDTAKGILTRAIEKKVRIILPEDYVVAKEISQDAEATEEVGSIPEGYLGVDIGSRTITRFKAELQDAKTVFWNGPLGVFEIDKFSRGTREIAKCLGDIKATVVIGGGDTVAAAVKFGISDKVSLVSTGGGASLEFIEGRGLPGIAALYQK